MNLVEKVRIRPALFVAGAPVRLVKSASMKYPSIAEVIAADQEHVSFLWIFLPDPKTPEEERMLDLIFKKFYVSGGFIEPGLAKRVRRAAAK